MQHFPILHKIVVVGWHLVGPQVIHVMKAFCYELMVVEMWVRIVTSVILLLVLCFFLQFVKRCVGAC